MTKTIGVMGLGLMGSAIATRLLEMRSPIVVWNRTAARATPLVDAGAEWVETPAALFAAADVVIAITASTAEVEAAVGSSGARLDGVDFINLVTGSPRQVRALKGAVEAAGGRFFSGTLQCYPAEIGQAEALILCAGDEGVWERQADVIRGLGGAAANLGADAAIPNVLDASVTACFFFGAMTCCLEAAKFAEKEGVEPKLFRELLNSALERMPGALNGLLDAVEAEDFASDQATLEIYARAQQLFLSAYRDIGASGVMTDAVTRRMRAAVEAGDGGLGFPALYRH